MFKTEGRYPIRSSWKGGLCLVLAMASVSAWSNDADSDIEEIVVTGTLIHTGIVSDAVPVTTIDSDYLDATAPADFKDIFRNMSFNASSLGLTSSNWVGDDNSYGNASVNVRNIGNGATLVLLNGKRIMSSEFDQNGGSYVDIQTLVPNIALDHLDILKDGTSAIYGSDAVAGVVNVITHNDFRGFDARIYMSQDHESSSQNDTTIEFLYGGSSRGFDFTLSASILERTALTYEDRFERFGRSGLSSFGQPGRYVALVDAGGPIAVTENFWWPNGGPEPSSFLGSLPDPECDKVAAEDGPMGVLGLHPNFPHICVYDYSSFFSMVRSESQHQIYATGEHSLDNDGSVYVATTYFNSSSIGDNSYYPDVRYVVIPEHNFGLQLDAARRGFEPVSYQGLQRVLGGTSQTSFADRPVDTRGRFMRRGSLFLVGIKTNWTAFDRNWDIDASLSFSSRKNTTTLPTDSISKRMDLAFDGLGGPNCDAGSGVPGSGNLGIGNCFYYNSFQTSVYDPATGSRWTDSGAPWGPNPTISVAQAALRYQNPPQLLQWLHGSYRSDRSTQQRLFDFIASTDLAQFRGGTLNLAFGTQVRRDSATTDYDDVANDFGFAFLSGDDDWSNSTTNWSLFTEVHVPLAQRINVYAALRREQIRDPDAVSVNPKISLLAVPHDDYSVRLSWGTSFKIGSLLQTGGSRTNFQNSSDPFSNAASLAYRASQAKGNPELTPQNAESMSVGFTWHPAAFDFFELELEWYRYEYSDLIIREGHQTLIDLDNALRCPDGLNGNIENGPLCGVWDNDGDGIETVFSVGQGIPDKVIRRQDGYLVRTEPRYVNANSLDASGLDVAASYFIPTQVGNFSISASATRFLTYELQLKSGLIVDGLGRRNAINSIGRPMPKYRASFTLDYSRDNRSASLSAYTIGGYRDESNQTAFVGAYLGYADSIEAMTTIDTQFQWCVTSPAFIRRPTSFSVGIKNLLNREPPLVIVDGAYDYYSHDPRGRIYYLRMRVTGNDQANNSCS